MFSFLKDLLSLGLLPEPGSHLQLGDFLGNNPACLPTYCLPLSNYSDVVWMSIPQIAIHVFSLGFQGDTVGR